MIAKPGIDGSAKAGQEGEYAYLHQTQADHHSHLA
jgi:hypothetical protein